MATQTVLPAWAKWPTNPEFGAWTVGVEEEVMLLETDGSPAWRSEDVLAIMPEHLAEHARGETHGLALELATNPHATVGEAASELRFMRAGLAATVRSLGLRVAVAGTHPLVKAEEVEVSPGARYQFLHQSLRELARREPTFALHVHVAVPDPEMAVRALNGMRAHIPVLLALSANSPFTRGRDSAGWRRRARRCSRPSRARASRASSALRRVRRVDRHPASAAARSPSRRSSGGTCACSPSSARSRSA